MADAVENVAEMAQAAQTVSTLLGTMSSPGPPGLWNNTRPLQLTVVNMDPRNSLMLTQQWFDCGDFWEQPFWNIGPYQFQTFSVCESDSFCGVKRGVSGGIGFLVRPASEAGLGSDAASRRKGRARTNVVSPSTSAVANASQDEMFICTSANPRFGRIKGMCSVEKVGSSDNPIREVWKQMESDVWIQSERCGFYRGELPGLNEAKQAEHSNKKMVVLWKSRDTNFDELLAAKARNSHNFNKTNIGIGAN